MEFVQRGVRRSHDERQSEDARAMLSKGPVEQRGQDGVLGKMPTFAHDELNRGDGCVRDLRREPAQKWTNESRGVFRRQQIGRSDEDENHPGENREPVFEKSAHRKPNHKAGACANGAALRIVGVSARRRDLGPALPRNALQWPN